MLVVYLEMHFKSKEHRKDTMMKNIRKWKEFMRRSSKTLKIGVHPEVCSFFIRFYKLLSRKKVQ